MASNNKLTLAVAGAGKTQQIVNECAKASVDESILVLTYTVANQQQLRERISASAGDHHQIEVSGWFSFLINHFARPYTPFLFPGQAVNGFESKSDYQRGMKTGDKRRYFTPDGDLRQVHLPHYADLLNAAADSHPLVRLARIYDRIFIDECQDLGGYDLEILDLLLQSPIPVHMVGDIRQATLSTNPQERKNSKYQLAGIRKWFEERQGRGLVEVEHLSVTQRCRPEIATLAYSFFEPSWDLEATTSANETVTEHDGIYLVRTKDVEAYMERFDPQPLRHGALSAKLFAHLAFRNFGAVKGLTRERVLIFPTAPMLQHIKTGAALGESAATAFYVAVTRARQSVAIVVDAPGQSSIDHWNPDADATSP